MGCGIETWYKVLFNQETPLYFIGNQIFSYVYFIVSIYAWVFLDFFLMSHLLSSKKYSFFFSFFGAQLHYVACANRTILAKSCSWHAAYSAEEKTWLQAFFKEYSLDQQIFALYTEISVGRTILVTKCFFHIAPTQIMSPNTTSHSFCRLSALPLDLHTYLSQGCSSFTPV